MKNKVIASALGLALSLPMMASAYNVPSIDYTAAGVADPASYDSIYDWRTSLSEEDMTALKEAHKALREQVRADIQNASDEEKEEIKAALRAKRDAKRAERKAQFQNLTDDQKAELKALRGDRKGKRGHGINKHKGLKGKFKGHFKDLDESQKSELKEMRAEFKAEHQGNKEDMSREERRELRKSFFEKARAYFGQ